MLKKLLLIGAIVAIIPLERENQADLYQVAKSTFRDITGFCGRNPGVCEKGNAAMDKFATKAEFGARMMVDIAKEQSGATVGGDPMSQLLKSTQSPSVKPTPYELAGKPGPIQTNDRFPTYRDNQYNEHYGSTNNTLSPTDLKPGWRGGSTR